jgi:hypothetical protein
MNSNSNSDIPSEGNVNVAKKIDMNLLGTPSIHFDANEFSLLHSLGVQKEFQFNALMKKIVQYHGSTFELTQKNNWLGFLILCP